jgi:hypothetical protein
MLAVQIFFQPWYALHVSEISIADYFKQSILPPIAAFVGVMGAGVALRTLLHPVAFGTQIVAAMLESIVALCLGWILISAEDRQMVMRRFGR